MMTSLDSNSRFRGRILMVDTDPEVCDLVRSQLNLSDFDVETCSSFEDIFNIDLSQYVLMIIDISADDNFGLSLVEQLKQHRETANLGIIVCSLNMSPSNIISALNAGADDYLIKPFSLRELSVRVRSVLRRHI